MDMPSLLKGKTVNYEENQNMTVLTHAVLANNIKLVKWLCSMGKDDPNQKDGLGFTATHYACQMGYIKILKLLVKHDADLESRTLDGYTPLMLAIIKGKKECAEYLINDCNCDLLTTDNDGLNVFQRSCASGELPMAKWLIEKGGFRPYVNIPTSTTYTNTVVQPLNVPDLAVSFAITELYVQSLLDSGFEPEAMNFAAVELEPSIDHLITAINSRDSPIPLLTTTAASSSPNVSGPSIQLPNGLNTTKSKDRSRSSSRVFQQPSNNIAIQSPTSLPQLDSAEKPTQDPSKFDPCTPICRSQLIALRALAQRSSQIMSNHHCSFLHNNTILHKPLSSSAAMYRNLAQSNLSVQYGVQYQAAYRNWEESIPLYEQPDPGALFLLQRAYNFRNQVLDHQFYDKAVIQFNYPPKDAQFSALEMKNKQFLQEQKELLAKQGIAITQEDYPDLWALDRHFESATNSIRTDLENIKERPVEFAAGSTPLMLAAGYGHQHMVDWLLQECHVDLHHVNSHGLKAWQVALRSRFIHLFISLFQASNASLDDLDRHGNTALLDAILNLDIQLVFFLLILGANPHVVDQNGKTLLMHAAIEGCLDISKVLIDSGLDLSLENNDGHDVQTVAVSHSQWAIVKLIEEALEKNALEQLEAESGGLGGVDLGLDDPQNIPTIDWNSVMQAAQDLDIDVVDYCNRFGIDVKLLDKSGRNFLHHAAINGRFEHVKVLVEKGSMNIRAKQTKAFRIYAKGTKGMNALEMALHKKWFSIYCYLFLESSLFHDTRPMNSIVAKHTQAFSDLEANTIHEFAYSARDALSRSPNPLIICLRLVWLFNQISELDRIHRQLYIQLAEQYNKYAIKLLEAIPHQSLVSWVLEEPDALNNTALKIATMSDNMTFLSHHLVDKVLSTLWNQSDDPQAADLFPVSHLVRRPWMKRMIADFGLIARVLLFTIFLIYRIEINDSLHVIEILSYVFTLSQLLPGQPPSDKRVNAVTKKSTTTNAPATSDLLLEEADENDRESDLNRSTAFTQPPQPPQVPSGDQMLILSPVSTPQPIQTLFVDLPGSGTSTVEIETPSKSPTNKRFDTSLLGIEMTSSQPTSPHLSQNPVRRQSISQLHGATMGTVAAESDSDHETSSEEDYVKIPQRSQSYLRSSQQNPLGSAEELPKSQSSAGPSAQEQLLNPTQLPEETLENGTFLSSQQQQQLDATMQQERIDVLNYKQLRQQRREHKELKKQMTGKQSTKFEQLVQHLTQDGWAFGDLVIAFMTLIMLIVRVIPEQTGNGETARYTIYLACMAFLPMLYYWRILQIFVNLETTGPQLIMVFKMVDDILKFGILFVVPMVIGFLQYFFLAMDPRVPDAPGYEDAKNIIVTLWNAWWNQIQYDFSMYDTPRQTLLIIVSILLTFIASWFLFNMLVGLMAATIDDVMVNSHSEFASQLVKTRWQLDQSLLQPPPPFSLLHVILVQFIGFIAKIPGIKNIGPFKHHAALWCAYCGIRWSNEPFSITRPGNGAEKRYPPYVLFEYSPQEAGKRLCHHCLRVQRVLSWRQKMSEWVAEMIIRCIIFIPLVAFVLFVYPFQLCSRAYDKYKIKQEYKKGSRKLTSLFATTPYEYSFFSFDLLPQLKFKFEKKQQLRQKQLNTVQDSATNGGDFDSIDSTTAKGVEKKSQD